MGNRRYTGLARFLRGMHPFPWWGGFLSQRSAMAAEQSLQSRPMLCLLYLHGNAVGIDLQRAQYMSDSYCSRFVGPHDPIQGQEPLYGLSTCLHPAASNAERHSMNAAAATMIHNKQPRCSSPCHCVADARAVAAAGTALLGCMSTPQMRRQGGPSW